MKKVKWGILSTAKIGLAKVIPAMRKSHLIEVAAIASRGIEAAQGAANSIGIEKAYGSYEDLLADPEIDAVYNPLPNHLHVPWTLRAAQAGKHVLCEKPMALSAAEIDELAAVEGKVLIMEGFMVRHSTQWRAARERIQAGELGPVKLIQSFFSYNNPDPNNIRNKLDVGGGGLMDIGCYPIVAGRFFFDAEPKRVIALVERSQAFGTDVITSGLLDFGEGRQLSFSVSTGLARGQLLTIFGPDKRLTITVPYNAQPDEPNSWSTDDGSALNGSSAHWHHMDVSDQYTHMAEDFSRAVLGEIPLPYRLDDARANMRVIDALFRSEKSGKWEMVG
jgi:predicted dehydrogenase